MRASAAMMVWVLVALAGTPAGAAEVLTDPDPTSIFLLQYKMAKAMPPYAEMTPSVESVQRANEFQRAEASARADASLHAKAASLANVKEIAVHLVSRFSEYDLQSGEYEFDLNDGSYIPFNAFGRQVRLALTNGTEAQAWKLSPKDAEDVLRKNRGGRSATLVLKLDLEDSPPAVDGEPMVLNAKITGYEVVTTYGHVRLGAMTVAAAP